MRNLFVLLMFAITLAAQTPPRIPDSDRTEALALANKIQNWELKVRRLQEAFQKQLEDLQRRMNASLQEEIQKARADTDKHQADLDAILVKYHRDGWVIDSEFNYVQDTEENRTNSADELLGLRQRRERVNPPKPPAPEPTKTNATTRSK